MQIFCVYIHVCVNAVHHFQIACVLHLKHVHTKLSVSIFQNKPVYKPPTYYSFAARIGHLSFIPSTTEDEMIFTGTRPMYLHIGTYLQSTYVIRTSSKLTTADTWEHM